jgi:hypothetical protein
MFLTIEIMDSKDGLPHQKLAAITGPHGQPQHATDLAGRTIDGLSQSPSTQVIAGLSTSPDVPPEPEEIFPVGTTGIRVSRQERITAESSRSEILADKKAFLESGDAIGSKADLPILQPRFQAVEVMRQSSSRWQVTRGMESQPDSHWSLPG